MTMDVTPIDRSFVVSHHLAPVPSPTVSVDGVPVAGQLAALRRLQEDHPLWRCALLDSFAQGALSLDDLRYVFSQYHYYSSSFTRFIAGVMANCDNDLFRAQLSENLWEEGGGCEPARRHAQIFRDFLQRGLGVDLGQIDYAPHTRQFVRSYLAYALEAGPIAGAAFLSLGTEGIVARLYQVMRSGLRKAGVGEDELEFFHIHIACDDAHAETLEAMMVSYAREPGWFEACAAAAQHALDLRLEFFDHLHAALRQRRLQPMLDRIQNRASLAQGTPDAALVHRPSDDAVSLYANEVARLNIDFTVERLPLAGEVLDPRVVRIPAGKFNENHKHAHETLIHILAGSGHVVIDGRRLPVATGDTVLVPRWAMHQTQNGEDSAMTFLAVTDFRLSQRALVGDATDYRMTVDLDGLHR